MEVQLCATVVNFSEVCPFPQVNVSGRGAEERPLRHASSGGLQAENHRCTGQFVLLSVGVFFFLLVCAITQSGSSTQGTKSSLEYRDV